MTDIIDDVEIDYDATIEDEEVFEDGDDLIRAVPATRQPSKGGDNVEDVQLGDWFWVQATAQWDSGGRKKGDKYEWLGCVAHVGSNYVLIKSPPSDRGGSEQRIHFDHFWKMLRREHDPETVIKNQIDRAQGHINLLMGQVQEITARLGVVPKQQITAQGTEDSGGSLAVISEQVDTAAYKQSLIKAKDEDLPALFKAIKEGHGELVRWMSAMALPAMAQAGQMKGVIGTIEDRLFTVSLYAGLTEESVKCCDGEPADMGEPLHIMQRRLYMDEEYLVSYEPNGIEIKDTCDFDRWISIPENRDRLLPFPRTLVAFRVRHYDKERDDGGNVAIAIQNFYKAEADKTTFLYIRNGEQVWRLDCDFTFGTSIFPSETGLGVEEMMIDSRWHTDVKLMPKREYDDRVAEAIESKRLHDEWEKANPEEHHFHNPHRYDSDWLENGRGNWSLFNASSVYYDDAVAKLAAVDKQHNRLAVIVQGLYDRSLVLHPHPPVKVWDPYSFERSIVLIHDANALVDGDPPDFEAYRAKLNASLAIGSITVGQETVWLRREAVKENNRRANDCRRRREYERELTFYRPYGNPGPGKLAVVAELKPRSKKATFKWTREMRGRDNWGQEADVSIEVDSAMLLNVSAYKPGDFKQFFADHRTRAAYLKWAPLLLAAEDYHAGKLAVGTSDKDYY